jgi:hypothetical protein
MTPPREFSSSGAARLPQILRNRSTAVPLSSSMGLAALGRVFLLWSGPTAGTSWPAAWFKSRHPAKATRVRDPDGTSFLHHRTFNRAGDRIHRFAQRGADRAPGRRAQRSAFAHEPAIQSRHPSRNACAIGNPIRAHGGEIAAGTLAVGADNNLGAAAGGITFAGAGTLQFLSSFTTSRAVTSNATGTFDTQANTDTRAPSERWRTVRLVTLADVLIRSPSLPRLRKMRIARRDHRRATHGDRTMRYCRPLVDSLPPLLPEAPPPLGERPVWPEPWLEPPAPTLPWPDVPWRTLPWPGAPWRAPAPAPTLSRVVLEPWTVVDVPLRTVVRVEVPPPTATPPARRL